MTKPTKKNIRIGRPPRYDFGSIRLGGKKFIAAEGEKAVKRVADAASKYASRNWITLKTSATDDGLGVDVRRPKPRPTK